MGIARFAIRCALTVLFTITASSISRGSFAAEPTATTSLDAPISPVGQFRAQLEALQKLADTGDVTAMYQLGSRYASGQGVVRDPVKAATWLAKAAQAGNTRAMVELGQAYSSGDGVKQDDAEAVRWYRKASDASDPLGLTALGEAYQRGTGVEKDSKQALAYLTRAADAGSDHAMLALALMYKQGNGVARDVTKAAKRMETYPAALRKSAEAGDTRAMLRLSLRSGFGASNAGEAARWARRAADAGSIEAINQLGDWYRTGTHVAKDAVAAVAWFKLAADLGDTTGMIQLGEMCAAGEGVSKDPPIGLLWFRKAMDLGDPEGGAHVAQAYENGAGVPQDLAEAQRWYTKAAEDGSSLALQHFASSLDGDPFALSGKIGGESNGQQMTLGAALNLLQDITARASFHANWKALATEGIGRNRIIHLTATKDTRLADVLTSILSQVGDSTKIAYRAERSIVYISTPADIQAQTETSHRRAQRLSELLKSASPPPVVPLLSRLLPEVAFTGNNFSDVCEFLQDVSTMKIVVPWDKLAAQGITKETQIIVRLHEVSVARALDVILADAGGGKSMLDYEIDPVESKITVIAPPAAK